ncbi:MAG TPA: hypothetical protein VIH53_14295 [Gemmatimonadaceae bacterium]|jgi:hypothetical protein
MLKRISCAVAVAALTACASTNSSGAGSNTGAVHRESNVITQEEIAASMESNAYDAVARLRPLFLKTRGRTSINAQGDEHATVFVDGQRYGDLNALKSIVANQIHVIRYFSGPEAVTKFGMEYGSGAIEVLTR